MGVPLKRLGLVSLFVIASALPRLARADDGATIAGVQANFSGGVWLTTSQRAVDVELTRAGWPELPFISPEFQLGFGLTFYGATLDIHFQGSDVSLPGSTGAEDALEVYRGAITVDLGYRFRLGRVITVSPFAGIGSLDSTLCFVGRPDATSSTSRPPFEQILRNPGRRACLEASAVGLDVGLSFALNVKLSFDRSKDTAMAGHLSIGPKLGYTLPLVSTRTWEKTSSSELKAELPAFEGPVAPLGGLYAGLEAQVRFEGAL